MRAESAPRYPLVAGFTFARLLTPFLLLGALLAAQQATATTYHHRTPEEMALAADRIFVGTVDAVRLDDSAETPWTEVSFRVDEWLVEAGQLVNREDPEGDLPAVTSLRFLGGATADGQRMTVSGLPQFRPGQRTLVFAYDAPGLASPIVGVRQGVWTLSVRGAQGEDGTYLTVPSEGRLATGPEGAGLEELLTSLAALLDGRTLPVADDQPEAPETQPETEPDQATEPETQPETEAEAEQETEPDQATDPDLVTEPGAETEVEAGQESESEPETEPEAETEPGPAEEGEGPLDDPLDHQADQLDDPPADHLSEAQPVVVHYRVDESGGPLLLSDAVADAAAAWQAAAPGSVTFVATEGEPAGEGPATPSAVHSIGYGAAELFGPDALSFTLVRSGSSAVQVLVSPTAGADLGAALLHELGVLIGLPEEGEGVMRSALTPGATSPAPVDVSALRDLRTFRPEDINRDGVVDFYDLAELAAAFGDRGVNLAADLNGDGEVNDADLQILRDAYRFLPPSETPPD